MVAFDNSQQSEIRAACEKVSVRPSFAQLVSYWDEFSRHVQEGFGKEVLPIPGWGDDLIFEYYRGLENRRAIEMVSENVSADTARMINTLISDSDAIFSDATVPMILSVHIMSKSPRAASFLKNI